MDKVKAMLQELREEWFDEETIISAFYRSQSISSGFIDSIGAKEQFLEYCKEPIGNGSQLVEHCKELFVRCSE